MTNLLWIFWPQVAPQGALGTAAVAPPLSIHSRLLRVNS